MSQQCVHLHTTRELDATERILKMQGMEIIVQSNHANLRFSDLTDEEKKSYMLEVEKELKEQLEFNEKTLKRFGMLMKDYSKFKKSIFASLDLIKNSNGKIRTTKAYDKYSSNIMSLGNSFMDCFHGMTQIAFPLGLIPISWRRTQNSSVAIGTFGTIRCSLLVAKKGDNTVRYLSFKRDPILTITGPEAKNLKSTLQSKF